MLQWVARVLQWVARLLLWDAMSCNDVTMRCYGVAMALQEVRLFWGCLVAVRYTFRHSQGVARGCYVQYVVF